MRSKMLSNMFAGIAFLSAPSMAAPQCKAITDGGIYDYTYSSFDSEHASAFVDWLRTHREATYQDAKSQGFGLSVPIDDVLIGAKYSSDEAGYRKFVDDLDSYQSGTSASKIKMQTSAKTINPIVIKAIEKCLLQSGLHVWLETTPDVNQFHLAAVFHSAGNPPVATIRYVDLGSARCGNPNQANPIRVGAQITGSTVRERCTRTDPKQAIDIIINADVDPLEGGTLNLWPITPPPSPVLGTWNGQWVLLANPGQVADVELVISQSDTALKATELNKTARMTVPDVVVDAKFEDGAFSYIQGTPCGNAVRLDLINGRLIGKAYPSVKPACQTFDREHPTYSLSFSK